uniref:C2H2-type domain-containing protein n=1 Tax=Panagrolaimus davidi TaxID=227884 RepID=A0A914NYU7_9BILA
MWKHHGIGQGKKMKVGKAALKNNLLINLTTSDTFDGKYIFWQNTGSVAEKKKEKKAAAKQSDSDSDDEDSNEDSRYKLFQCNEPNCIKKYVNYGNLVNHMESGKHRYKLLRKTLYDYALKKFGEHLDDLKEHQLQLYARETFQDFVTTSDVIVNEGWALRVNAKNKRFSDDVHKFVEELLTECIRKKKRFDPKVAEEVMENAKKSNGKSRFSPSERLHSTQLSGLAQRKLKKMKASLNDQIDTEILRNDRVLINDEIEADTGKWFTMRLETLNIFQEILKLNLKMIQTMLQL